MKGSTDFSAPPSLHRNFSSRRSGWLDRSASEEPFAASSPYLQTSCIQAPEIYSGRCDPTFISVLQLFRFCRQYFFRRFPSSFRVADGNVRQCSIATEPIRIDGSSFNCRMSGRSGGTNGMWRSPRDVCSMKSERSTLKGSTRWYGVPSMNGSMKRSLKEDSRDPAAPLHYKR